MNKPSNDEVFKNSVKQIYEKGYNDAIESLTDGNPFRIPVAVIECKNCRRWTRSKRAAGYCTQHNSYTNANDYCSSGVFRDEYVCHH